MSKIRTLSELQEEMAAEFAWRKKELTGLKTIVIANETTHNRALCVRAAITLLYAHWEGFVKNIGTFYLGFVAKRKLKHSELADSFLAFSISGLMRDAATNNTVQPSLDLVALFRSHSDTRSSLKWRNGIRTKGNLGSAVFREIVQVLGLDYSRFATKEKLIDEKLLHTRNNVAHGHSLAMESKEYLALHDVVFGMMQDFYNQVENAATTGTYRATALP
jgi:MAE_28990/MAE_18760-like HEPN